MQDEMVEMSSGKETWEPCLSGSEVLRRLSTWRHDTQLLHTGNQFIALLSGPQHHTRMIIDTHM